MALAICVVLGVCFVWRTYDRIGLWWDVGFVALVYSNRLAFSVVVFL